MEYFTANIQSQIEQKKDFTQNYRGRGGDDYNKKRASFGLPKSQPCS
jgi:hypothetical protein